VSIEVDARFSGPPLDRDKAVRLDEEIQAMADKVGEHLDYSADLLAEAQEGQIHQALQFDSWTAYLVDPLKPITKALDADDRHELVVQLYEAGMSVQAIAEAVDTSKSTVSRQVSQSGMSHWSAKRTKPWALWR
jgi:DNA-binding NarL/FixJ family response regulator